MKQLTLSFVFVLFMFTGFSQEVDPTKQLQLNVQTVPSFMTNYKLDTVDVMNVTDQVVYLRGFGKAVKLSTDFLKYRNLVRQYGKTGLVTSPTKIWSDTSSVTTGNGQIVDISSAGFSKITSIQANVQYNTAVSSSVPIVELKSFTNSAVVFNILQPSNTTLNLGIITAGLTVPGLTFLASPSNVILHVTVIGY